MGFLVYDCSIICDSYAENMWQLKRIDKNEAFLSPGKLVYVGYTYTDPNEAPPGATYPFKLIVFSAERSSKITRYSLIAESMNSGYTSVPETPWPGILMAAALTVAVVVVVRRKRVQGAATSSRLKE